MRSAHARLIHQAALTSALLTLTGATLLPSAQAQELDLGMDNSTTVSGTATLTNTGTTAGGTYTYYNGAGKPAPLDPTQNNYVFWNVYGPSTANISGGSIQHFESRDADTATVSGGSIGDMSNPALAAFTNLGTSTVNVIGGSISNLVTYDSSTAYVSGGSVGSLSTSSTNTVNVSGGSIGSLGTSGPGTIDLFGTNLTETPASNPASTPNSSFALNSNSMSYYEVTGTLLDGTAIDAPFTDDGGTLEFNGVPAAAVPETSTVVSLGVLLALGLGGLVLGARRKAAAG